MYYLTDFKHFVSIFPSFSIQLTPFSINFKCFDPSFLQKLRSEWVYFFVCAIPGYRKFDEVTLSKTFKSEMDDAYIESKDIIVMGDCSVDL